MDNNCVTASKPTEHEPSSWPLTGTMESKMRRQKAPQNAEMQVGSAGEGPATDDLSVSLWQSESAPKDDAGPQDHKLTPDC